ncbi:hypothetical protein [Polyangium sorediatum]|uniref:Uncharacterized protein n=1 Tax=Polyangium sorediatum TaxID=889274 RepID=A0ABT6P2U1_9BACT|nr:hypothetical protein [Polyangium sorediatum]MDI1434917.1 hypothetical protein [Polyangium sorediatum]
MKKFALQQRLRRAAIQPETPLLITLGLGNFSSESRDLLDYLRSHCSFMLVGETSEWGAYFYAVNGAENAKDFMKKLFDQSGVPTYEVERERDLPVW